MQYFHIPSKKMVEVEHQYSHAWYYSENGGECQKGFPYDFRELNDYVQVYSGSSSPQLSPSPGSPGSSPRIIEMADGKEGGLQFNLNQAKSKTAISEGVVGIGKVQGLALLNNRPESGYKDWADLIEINKDLPVNWEEIQKDNPHVIF